MSFLRLDFSAHGPHRFHAVAGTVHTVQIVRRAAAGETFNGHWERFVLVDTLDTLKPRYFVRRDSLHRTWDEAAKEADAQALAQAYSEQG